MVILATHQTCLNPFLRCYYKLLKVQPISLVCLFKVVKFHRINQCIIRTNIDVILNYCLYVMM